jgi:hypothetical protein
MDKIVVAVDDFGDPPEIVPGKSAESLDRRLARLMPYEKRTIGRNSGRPGKTVGG